MSNKVVPLICEGYSDLIALEGYLNDVFSDAGIKFVVASGDILGDNDNYDKYLADLIEETIFSSPRDFELDDILAIAHLIDTDGVFENDSVVKYDASVEHTLYYDNEIRVSKNVPETIEGRKRRRERINDCVDTPTIVIKNRTFNYSIYYMSTNLEHVTQDNRNVIDGREKNTLAGEFASRFDDANKFISFLQANNASNTDDYKKSWDYIRKHSLDKATNLIIFVKKLRDYLLSLSKQEDEEESHNK